MTCTVIVHLWFFCQLSAVLGRASHCSPLQRVEHSPVVAHNQPLISVKDNTIVITEEGKRHISFNGGATWLYIALANSVRAQDLGALCEEYDSSGICVRTSNVFYYINSNTPNLLFATTDLLREGHVILDTQKQFGENLALNDVSSVWHFIFVASGNLSGEKSGGLLVSRNRGHDWKITRNTENICLQSVYAAPQHTKLYQPVHILGEDRSGPFLTASYDHGLNILSPLKKGVPAKGEIFYVSGSIFVVPDDGGVVCLRGTDVIVLLPGDGLPTAAARRYSHIAGGFPAYVFLGSKPPEVALIVSADAGRTWEHVQFPSDIAGSQTAEMGPLGFDEKNSTMYALLRHSYHEPWQLLMSTCRSSSSKL